MWLLLMICFWSARDNRNDFGRGRTTAAVDAVVVGGILLPHGDFALDPTFFASGTIEREAADEVATGARSAGRWLIELLHQKHHRTTANHTRIKAIGDTQYNNSLETQDEPTIVLLTTPHGIKLDYDYGIYVGSKGTGTASIGGDCTNVRESSNYSGIRGSVESASQRFTRLKEDTHHCQHKPYNVTLENIDLAPMPLAEDLLTRLRQEKNHPVSGIYSYNDEAPIPLNWGEIIPLLLLPSFATTSSKKNSSLLPLIWTFPYRRYNHSVEMVPELLQIGAYIMEWAQQRPEKIAIIVSGDLSHTHQPSGPYGYSAASSLFDEAIGVWAGGNTNTTENFGRNWDPCRPEAAHALLNRAKELQPDAKSCGFTGYVLWHGMVCSSSTFVEFDSKVLVNRNVTYYGMMGAIFEAKPKSDDGISRVDDGMTEEEQ